MLTVENVRKNYVQGESQIEVLKGVDLQVQSGETVAILGESGSGKSTLLSLLAGLDRPDQGRIVLDSKDFSTLSEETMTQFRGQNIGIVFQQYHLLPHLTALENVSLPLEIAGFDLKKASSLAEEALAQVKLPHRQRHFPHQLSGGECQRAAIARALVTRPRVLLADEPSGNLDSQTGRQVMDLLFSLVKEVGMTTVLVTHSEELALRCQRQTRLVDGKLISAVFTTREVVDAHR